MIRVLDSAGSTLVEWGRQQQQEGGEEGFQEMLLAGNVKRILENNQHPCSKNMVSSLLHKHN